MEWILNYFIDENKRSLFYQFYRQLSNLYDIISPDSFLRPYIKKMNTFTRIYNIVREALDPSIKINKELSEKVIKLLQENVSQSDIQDSLEIYEIN